MAKIGVQSEDIRQQSTNVNKGSAEVTDILTRLTGEIASLAGTWQGAASQAFQDRWQEWQNGATQVQQAMEHMGQFLAQAAEAYETTEDQLRAASSG
jgi:WXG100 family type VII secretion target